MVAGWAINLMRRALGAHSLILVVAVAVFPALNTLALLVEDGVGLAPAFPHLVTPWTDNSEDAMAGKERVERVENRLGAPDSRQGCYGLCRCR